MKLGIGNEISTWNALQPLWEGNDDDIRNGLSHDLLSPAWQMLLLGDGSPTRHLQLLTGEVTTVETIEMMSIGKDIDGAPPVVQAISSPRVRRQVWLQTASGKRLGYAASWWGSEDVDEYLRDRSQPIWASLAARRTELYRDIRGICYGESETIAAGFGEKGPFWGRYYLFWHGGKPFTLIYEVFSPYLQKYLGPASGLSLPAYLNR